jgi:hypothetical protein
MRPPALRKREGAGFIADMSPSGEKAISFRAFKETTDGPIAGMRRVGCLICKLPQVAELEREYDAGERKADLHRWLHSLGHTHVTRNALDYHLRECPRQEQK